MVSPTTTGKQTSTLVQQATEAIREEILSGRFADGSRIALIQTSTGLAMSPIPVREALHRLVAEGLVDLLPQRGFRVRPLSLAALDDVYRLREVLEPMAVRMAVPRLDAASLCEAEDAYVSILKAAHEGPPHTLRQHHRDFHFAIYKQCGSPWLLRVCQLIWNDSERYHRMALLKEPERATEHGVILEACRRSDAEKAAVELEHHLLRSHDRVRRAIEPRFNEASAVAAAT